MKKCLFLLLIVFLFFSCSKRQTGFLPVGADYTIDLDGDKESSMPYSSIFKKAQTIILESGENCMIGRITELQVFDDCIYILDGRFAKSMFVFDREGKFLRKIGSIGAGPGEYVKVQDFTIDTGNRLIFLLDEGNRVHKYQLDGTYVHSFTIQMPRSNTYFIQFYDGSLYSSIISWDPGPDDYMLFEIDPDNGKILSKSLPVKYNKGWVRQSFTGHSFFMLRLNSPPRYAQLFMDYIVSIGDSITPYIELKSKNLVREKDLEILQDVMSSFWPFRGSSKIWDVRNFMESNDLITFSYTSGFLDGYTVVFHKETATVKTAKQLSNDLVLKQGNFGRFVSFEFSDRQGAYETHGAEYIRKSIKENNVVPGLDKIDQLMQLNEESNPVIFYYEFK